MDYIISKFNDLSFPNIYDNEPYFWGKKLEKFTLSFMDYIISKFNILSFPNIL